MDSTTSDIPRKVSDILINLNIIRNIPTNHKLNVSTKTYVNADSKIEGFWRWWYSETGDSTVDFIDKTINDAIKVCKEYPSWIEHISQIVSDLTDSLLNLRQIYKRLNQEATVGRIGLIEVRINRDRFTRACKGSESSNKISDAFQTRPVPIPGSDPFLTSPTISNSLTPDVNTPHHCNNCAKGTSPTVTHTVTHTVTPDSDSAKTPEPVPVPNSNSAKNPEPVQTPKSAPNSNSSGK